MKARKRGVESVLVYTRGDERASEQVSEQVSDKLVEGNRERASTVTPSHTCSCSDVVSFKSMDTVPIGVMVEVLMRVEEAVGEVDAAEAGVRGRGEEVVFFDFLLDLRRMYAKLLHSTRAHTHV